MSDQNQFQGTKIHYLQSGATPPAMDDASGRSSGDSRQDGKGRQFSGGKTSFFSRKLHRDRGNQSAQAPSEHAASVRPSTSRHSHSVSGNSNERPMSHLGEPTGLNMQAGVITSIPYDSTSANTNQPITVDYLPKEDRRQPVRRDVLPHQLNKTGGDFHQYPSFDPSSLSVKNPHPSGPRPAPSSLNGTSNASRSSERSPIGQMPYQQSFFASSDGSNIPRKSFDQTSIYSNSSQNKAPSVVSLPFYQQTTPISPNADTQSLHPSQSNSAIRNHIHHPQHLSPQNTHSPDGFNFVRPQDDRVIEQEFLALMHKRGWKGLPEQARRQMEAYPVAKKWTLVYQDRLSEWQGEQKRRANARNTIVGDSPTGFVGRAEEEGSPEWYVKRVMNNSITVKELQSLSVSLRTQEIGWVQQFIALQGQIALTSALGKINRRQVQSSVPTAVPVSDKDMDREYEIIKCLKALMNNKYGADDALAHPQIITSLAGCLTSTRLNTRKLVSEVLTFLCHWGESGAGHLKVIQAFDSLKHAQVENGRFDAWMRTVEVTIDGRGKMGSMVGASDEVRSGGIGVENLLMEYAVATLIFVNMIVDAQERDLNLRCHLRSQLTTSGIKRILTKMEGFQYEIIDIQIEKYRNNEAIDYEDFMERENSSVKDSIDGEARDLNDPVQIADAIQSKVQHDRSKDYFLSAMQHMLLIRDSAGDERLRMFQLVDSMLSYVAMDRRLPDMDLKQSLNFTVQSLLDKLYTDSEARQARDEAVESRQIAEAAMAERDHMRAQVELGGDGLVAKLQKQIEEQQAVISLQARTNASLKFDLQEMQRLRTQDLQRSELETRELYLMLRDAQDAAEASQRSLKGSGTPSVQSQGILDREKLMDQLERQLERAKTQAKLEGKVWQQAAPSDKLRELREKMDESALLSAENIIRGSPDDGYFGTFSRKRSKFSPIEHDGAADDATHEDNEGFGEMDANTEDAIINETPRIVDLRQVPGQRPKEIGYLNEIVSKVRRYDASDDEDADGDADNDGITTGPTHPSLESDNPKTPQDQASPARATKISGPPAADTSTNVLAMPGFTGGPPPPPPPMPALSNRSSASGMPGFSGAPPPPPPPMPGFNSNAPPPPPMPPNPGEVAQNEHSLAPLAIPEAPPLPGKRTLITPAVAPTELLSPKVGMAVARPKKKLKALHWEKVDAPQVTIWASHAPTHAEKAEKYLELSRRGVLDEVEKLFMAKEIKQLGTGTSKKSEKKQIISSDLMRTYHVSLRKFSQYSVEKVVKMIIHCDIEVLENVVVMDFLQRNDLCDIPENTAKLMAPYSKDWTGPDAASSSREQDPSELTREDQIYLYTAYELHHYWKSRMRALAMTRDYEHEYDQISVKLRQVVTVSESLRDSVSLMNVLGLILDIGNYMNDTNKQANGFKLSSLARLGLVKDDKNESTFADLVERIVRTQYPEWENFTEEISGVITAQKLNVEMLKLDAKRYIDNINNVQASLDSGNLSDPKKFHPEDRVSQVVQRSMKEARRKAEQMQLYLDDMNKSYEDIMTFYGEDALDENARRDFFPKLATFLTEWKRSREKNMVWEDMRRRNEASMRRKQAVPGMANGLSSESSNSASTGAMDSLLEKLRAAAPQARDQRDRRRRARLKDKHQVRVASGQKLPDLPTMGEGSRDASELQTPASELSQSEATGTPGGDANGDGEHVADRAASLLQGLRGEGDDESARLRRRRENGEEERLRRRQRRRGGAGGNSTAGSESASAAAEVMSPAPRPSSMDADEAVPVAHDTATDTAANVGENDEPAQKPQQVDSDEDDNSDYGQADADDSSTMLTTSTTAVLRPSSRRQSGSDAERDGSDESDST